MAALDAPTMAMIAAALAGAVSIVLLLTMTAGPSRKLRGRVDRIQQRCAHDGDGNGAGVRNLRRDDASSFAWLDSLMKRYLPRPALLRRRLDKTGKSISLGAYAAVCIVLTIIFSGINSLTLPVPGSVAFMTGLSSGIVIPHIVIGFLIRRRIKHFLAGFADAIDLIVRGLKSGLPVPESIRSVGEEFEGPVGEEFRLVADRIKLGETLDVALAEAGKRIDLPEFQFFVISLAVQRETGGNLAETLANLSDILRKRRQMKLKIKAMSSEAKASAIIIGSLPFVMFLILKLVGGDYVMGLFNDPRGMMMVAIGAGFLIIGVAVMMKMVRFEI